MRKIFLFLVLIAAVVLLGARCAKKETPKAEEGVNGGFGNGEAIKTDQDKAVALAQELYEQKKKEGMNFENGPCLANDLMPDWVADIAHYPREKADDLPENQCSAFREGKAHHFVELDPEGNLIKAY